MIRFPNLPADHPANLEIPNGPSGKFEPKFIFAERCGIAAAILVGYSTRHVARAFEINRRTTTRMLSNSRSYRTLRAELMALGQENFIAKYFTEDIRDKLLQVKDDPELLETDAERDAAGSSSRTGQPNHRAKGHAGLSVYQGPTHNQTYRFDIQWHENPDGWMVQHLDIAGLEDGWMGDDDGKPFLTSAAALKYAKRWLDENQ